MINIDLAIESSNRCYTGARYPHLHTPRSPTAASTADNDDNDSNNDVNRTVVHCVSKTRHLTFDYNRQLL